MGGDRFQARQTESPRPAPASDEGAGQPMPTNHTEQVGLSVIPPGSRHSHTLPRHSRVGGNLPSRDWTHRSGELPSPSRHAAKVNGTEPLFHFTYR